MPHNRSIDVLEISFEQAEEFHACIPEFGNTRPRHSFLKRVGNKKHLVLGAQIEEQMVGYLIGYDRYKDGSFYCWMTGVLPAFRRQGVLEKLMEYALEWAKKEDFQTLKIKTRNNRRAMLSYLVKHDFLFTEVITKKHPHTHRIVLEKQL